MYAFYFVRLRFRLFYINSVTARPILVLFLRELFVLKNLCVYNNQNIILVFQQMDSFNFCYKILYNLGEPIFIFFTCWFAYTRLTFLVVYYVESVTRTEGLFCDNKLLHLR